MSGLCGGQRPGLAPAGDLLSCRATREEAKKRAPQSAAPALRSGANLRRGVCATQAERSDGPWGCWAAPNPFWMRRGAQGAGWRVCRRTHPLRKLARRGCPSGALQAQSEFHGAPRDRAPQVARSEAEGRRQQGRLLLPSFLGETRKEGALPGAHPGTRPPTRHKSYYQNNSFQRLPKKRRSQKVFNYPRQQRRSKPAYVRACAAAQSPRAASRPSWQSRSAPRAGRSRRHRRPTAEWPPHRSRG